MSFALNKQVRFTVGVVAGELTPLADESDSQRVNAALAEVGYAYRAPASGHHLEASYQWRAGLTGLDSDLAYRRHSGQALYRLDRGRSTFIADLRLGRISGRAPLFERFAIGDSSTLRGWNKYDIAPIGASRVAHQSVEYRFHRFAYFLDAGAMWDEGDAVRVRLATGVGFHADHAFVTVGVPLNADALRATFMLGVRF
jgi:outer membrane protein assembly factor BamA